jgi:hypothetical protein
MFRKAQINSAIRALYYSMRNNTTTWKNINSTLIKAHNHLIGYSDENNFCSWYGSFTIKRVIELYSTNLILQKVLLKLQPPTSISTSPQQRQYNDHNHQCLTITATTTPQQLHKFNKRDTSDSPWCPGTIGTIDHIFFDCPTVTAFWKRLTKTLHDLLGPHPLQKRNMLYG